MKRVPIGVTAIIIATMLTLVALATGCSSQSAASPTRTAEKVSLEASDAPAPANHASNANGGQAGATGSIAASSPSSSTSLPSSAPRAASSSKVSEAASQAAAIADASGMQVAVSVVDLASSDRDGHLADEPMVSASMIKLAIAYTFLEQVAAGVYSLDDYYTLQASDIVGGTGSLGSFGAGAQVTYGQLVNKMISESDNTATNILIDAVGMNAVNSTAQKLELSATQLNRYMMDSEAMANGVENYTSANDVAALLQMAYEGLFVNPECSAVMMEALEQQQDYGGIQGGLPAGVTFAHKTGTLGTVRHDGGIVECEHPFVLVTLCGGPGFYEQGALDVMAEIASSTYDILVN